MWGRRFHPAPVAFSTQVVQCPSCGNHQLFLTEHTKPENVDVWWGFHCIRCDIAFKTKCLVSHT